MVAGGRKPWMKLFGSGEMRHCTFSYDTVDIFQIKFNVVLFMAGQFPGF